jgi:putative membrane protein
MSMHRSTARAAGGLIIALGVGFSGMLHAQAQDANRDVINRAAAANLLEVRLGQAAQKQAENPSVKQYGQRMEADHSSMQKQWMSVARQNDIDFRVNLTPQQLEQVYRLKDLRGSAFDRAYMAAMVQNHQEDVTAFQAARNTAISADIRQLIDVALPSLQEHLTQAQQISNQVGRDMAVATPTVGDTSGPVTQAPQTTTASAVADSSFINEVEASNQAELRLARLATDQARDSTVEQFAERMITDHTWMEREWRALFARSGLRFGNNLNPRYQEQFTRLEKLSGTEFDRVYMSAMVQNHEEAVRSFQTQGRSARSSEVRALASRGLPYLQEHLDLARRVSSQVGAAQPIATIDDDKNRGTRGNIRADAEFIRDVDADHFLEIRLGRLAQTKGRDQAVRQFGRRMVQDHTTLQRQWTSMASRNGMDRKSGMGPRHRSKLTRLEKLSGREFDREYMTLMVQNHKDYLDYWRKEGRAAKSEPVRELVNRGIPMLERHMSEARQVGGRVGADTTPSRNGRISASQ